jgi:hypothetical protein
MQYAPQQQQYAPQQQQFQQPQQYPQQQPQQYAPQQQQPPQYAQQPQQQPMYQQPPQQQAAGTVVVVTAGGGGHSGAKCVGCQREVVFDVEDGLNDSAWLCCLVWSIIGTPLLGVICCLMQTEKKRVCPSCGTKNGSL